MIDLNSIPKKLIVPFGTECLRSVLKSLERINGKSDIVKESIIQIKNELEYRSMIIKGEEEKF